MFGFCHHAVNVCLSNVVQLHRAQCMAQQAVTHVDGFLGLLLFKVLTNAGTRSGTHHKVQPVRIRLRFGRRNNFYRLAIFQRLAQAEVATLNPHTYAGVTYIGVHRIGEVHRRCTRR